MKESQEQDFEEMYESEEEMSERSASAASQYSTFNPDAKLFFIGQKISGQERVLSVVIPARVTYHITGVSLAASNFSQNKHIIVMHHEDQQHVIARLLPNQAESVQLDIVVPAKYVQQQLFFILEGTEPGDVDVIGMLYQEDEDELQEEEEEYEEVSEAEYEAVRAQEKAAAMKIEAKPEAKPEKADPVAALYAQQAQAKAVEHKMDRAANKTQIEYKDVEVGTGKTAMQKARVHVKILLKDGGADGKTLEETPAGQSLAFQLGKEEVSAGLERIVLGMREGGTREARGPKTELIGEGLQGHAWVKVGLVSVK